MPLQIITPSLMFLSLIICRRVFKAQLRDSPLSWAPVKAHPLSSNTTGGAGTSSPLLLPLLPLLLLLPPPPPGAPSWTGTTRLGCFSTRLPFSVPSFPLFLLAHISSPVSLSLSLASPPPPRGGSCHNRRWNRFICP